MFLVYPKRTPNLDEWTVGVLKYQDSKWVVHEGLWAGGEYNRIPTIGSREHIRDLILHHVPWVATAKIILYPEKSEKFMSILLKIKCE